MINYYEILGLLDDADAYQIRDAYRKLSKKLHPDLNPDNSEAEETFKMIQQAYHVLKEPEKRKKYDEILRQHRQKVAFQSPKVISKRSSKKSVIIERSSSFSHHVPHLQQKHYNFLMSVLGLMVFILLLVFLEEVLFNQKQYVESFDTDIPPQVSPDSTHLIRGYYDNSQ